MRIILNILWSDVTDRSGTDIQGGVILEAVAYSPTPELTPR